MYQSTAMLPDYSWMCINNSATVVTVVAQQTAVIKVTIAKFQLFAAFYFHCTTELSTSPYTRPTERTKCLHWSSVKEPAFEKPHCKARKCLNYSEGDGTECIPKKEKTEQKTTPIDSRAHPHPRDRHSSFFLLLLFYSSSVYVSPAHAVLSYHVNHTRTKCNRKETEWIALKQFY